jgi:hypothetical protein
MSSAVKTKDITLYMYNIVEVVYLVRAEPPLVRKTGKKRTRSGEWSLEGGIPP